MNVKGFSTTELADILSNIENIKKELENRKENENKFLFNVGDVIYTKNKNNDYFILYIKEIDINNNNVVVDELVLRYSSTFDMFEDEWYYYNDIKWTEYTKIENSEIFNSIEDIINVYNKQIDDLTIKTYKELKTQIDDLTIKTDKELKTLVKL